ncbi:MAG: 16S rRNA (uracil(1498)-N(3))-methyltransferase [Candidatus Gastranaerophilales bacterium]|nr:16S rRNA (uracil(1498)-N(3))-methyltransferase [Candidatus Gastranaerophilales bacterium]
MPHFFINSKSIGNDVITITDRENYNHIAKSLRAKSGEKLLLIDENEIEYKTQIISIDNKSIATKIESFQKSNRDLPYNLFLAQSPLRSEAQSVIMEKSTELGIRGVYPVYTDNCALRRCIINSKIERWGKIMYEASKQCERANIPVCFPLCDMENLIKDKKFDRVIALCEKNTGSSLKEYLKTHPVKTGENILLLIGPEGGFSQREFNIMHENNLPMLSLGDLILKAETAVIVTLGNIIHEFGK